jgi:hypothetical protein
MASYASAAPPSIVSLSFRDVEYSNRTRSYVKTEGEPLLELEVIGEISNLEDVGLQLFHHYLGAVREESLYSHVWRFELPGQDFVRLNTEVPLLSIQTRKRPREEGAASPSTHTSISAGFEMIFFYDEGTTTRIAVTVDRIQPLPESLSVDLFPREKEAQIEEADAGDSSIKIDAIFPALSRCVFSKKYGKSFFGSGSEELHGAIESGPTQNGDQVYCPLQFESFEDAMILMESAMQLQEQIRSDPENPVREGWTNVVVFPTDTQNAADETSIDKHIKFFTRLDRLETIGRGSILASDYPPDDKPSNFELHMLCGPRMTSIRLPREEMDAKRALLRSKGFDLSILFPNIADVLKKPNTKNIFFRVHNNKLLIGAKLLKKGFISHFMSCFSKAILFAGDGREPKKVLHAPSKRCS